LPTLNHSKDYLDFTYAVTIAGSILGLKVSFAVRKHQDKPSLVTNFGGVEDIAFHGE
jgi:hypothetical protein